jgi:hypothetical protein
MLVTPPLPSTSNPIPHPMLPMYTSTYPSAYTKSSHHNHNTHPHPIINPLPPSIQTFKSPSTQHNPTPQAHPSSNSPRPYSRNSDSPRATRRPHAYSHSYHYRHRRNSLLSTLHLHLLHTHHHCPPCRRPRNSSVHCPVARTGFGSQRAGSHCRKVPGLLAQVPVSRYPAPAHSHMFVAGSSYRQVRLHLGRC